MKELLITLITLAGLFWAWGVDEDVLARLIRKTLYIGFFAFIIGNFNRLAGIVFQSFSGLGLKAGGSSLTADTLLQPGRVAQVGIDAGTGDDAQASEAVEGTLTGPEIEIAFNPHYLLDALNALDTPYVNFSFTAPGKPCLLTPLVEIDGEPSTDYKHVIMLMRLPQ